jgi:hypothetical protein
MPSIPEQTILLDDDGPYALGEGGDAFLDRLMEEFAITDRERLHEVVLVCAYELHHYLQMLGSEDLLPQANKLLGQIRADDAPQDNPLVKALLVKLVPFDTGQKLGKPGIKKEPLAMAVEVMLEVLSAYWRFDLGRAFTDDPAWAKGEDGRMVPTTAAGRFAYEIIEALSPGLGEEIRYRARDFSGPGGRPRPKQ